MKELTFIDLVQERWPNAEEEAIETLLWITPFPFTTVEKIIESLDAMRAKWGDKISDAINGEMAEFDKAMQLSQSRGSLPDTNSTRMNMKLRSKLQSELKESARPLLYVSRPTFFGVDYVINPWMDGQIGSVNRAVAMLQWKNLVKILRSLTDVRVVSCSDPKLPDVTFIANAGSFLPDGDKYSFVPSNFKHQERRGEQQFFVDELAWDDIKVSDKPFMVDFFEGDGDLLRLRDRLVVGHGFRTDHDVVKSLWKALDVHTDSVIPLKLVDPRFYHLDTCFFYHNHGNEDFCMYYPDAFDNHSRGILRKMMCELNIQCLEVTEHEALAMSCNAIGIGSKIVGHDFSQRIKTWLYSRNFFTMDAQLSEFHKAGGSAKCLTLRVPKGAIA